MLTGNQFWFVDHYGLREMISDAWLKDIQYYLDSAMSPSEAAGDVAWWYEA